MLEEDSGRPPAQAFFTVCDPEQARLLSDLKSFRYFEPFIARTQTAKSAAEAVGCNLDTMLYRVKTFLKAGLLKVERVEKRAGRPIKHYRSSHEAYLIPFEITPFAELEERLERQLKALQEPFAKGLAKLQREHGQEARELYRRNDGEVWQGSAGEAPNAFDFFSEDRRAWLERRRGRVGESLYDQLELTQEQARAFLAEFYDLWRRYKRLPTQTPAGRYHLQVVFVPEAS